MNDEDLAIRTVNLTKKFGELVAVDNVNLEVRRGFTHAIIGPNGAGKTTLFNLISGVLKPSSGRIYIKGEDVTGLPPHEIAKKKVGRSFQIPSLFSNLTILENVRLGIQARYKDKSIVFWRKLDSYPDITREAMRVLSIVGLWGRTSILARNLTPSDKRKLEIAMALAGDPDIILLDEPTAGVSIEELPDIVGLLKKIKSLGNKTIVVVEHKIDVVMDIADWITVMDRGKIIAEGEPKEISENELVQEVYLGRVG